MIDFDLKNAALPSNEEIAEFWDLSAAKLDKLTGRWDSSLGYPVISANGLFKGQDWTQWTAGFYFGSQILQCNGTSDFTSISALFEESHAKLRHHITNFAVHDHGFNIVSVYGNLLRLYHSGAIKSPEIKAISEQTLRVSGAVQACRWTKLNSKEGYIYSFNGRHSLFIDTIRTLRSLALAHQLGQSVTLEQDQNINLFHRLIQHALTTAKYNIYFGDGRDIYDVRGRTTHEALFNPESGTFRAPSTQQGYSPFSVWTRGLAWAILGLAEQLEYLRSVPEAEFEGAYNKPDVERVLINAAMAVADFYIENSPKDGVPYWDTGAPNLGRIPNYLTTESEPNNDFEPVDSSAAAIAAQGFLRLSCVLKHKVPAKAEGYRSIGLRITNTLLSERYLSRNPDHEGLLLHSVYHVPNGWDFVPEGSNIPNGESTAWGDYHMRELILYVQRMDSASNYVKFYLDI